MSPDRIGVRPPVPAHEALTLANFQTLQYVFVLDIADGSVQPVDIVDEVAGEGGISIPFPITWRDDDTLWLGHPVTPAELDLDGAVRIVDASPPTPTPSSGLSPGGDWQASQLASGSGGAIFQSPPYGDVLYRVASATRGAWSPTREVYALPGSYCAGWDLFLFDPQGGSGPKPGTLVNLTESDDRRFGDIGGFVWAPDGERIAAGAMNALVIIDTAHLTARDVATADPSLAVRPVAWNPSGQKLLFQIEPAPQVDCANRGEDAYLDAVPNLGGP